MINYVCNKKCKSCAYGIKRNKCYLCGKDKILFKLIILIRSVDMSNVDYDSCFYTGIYNDQDCSLCPYAEECSASELDDEDE